MMADNNVQILAEFKDEASAGVKKLGDSLKGLGDTKAADGLKKVEDASKKIGGHFNEAGKNAQSFFADLQDVARGGDGAAEAAGRMFQAFTGTGLASLKGLAASFAAATAGARMAKEEVGQLGKQASTSSGAMSNMAGSLTASVVGTQTGVKIATDNTSELSKITKAAAISFTVLEGKTNGAKVALEAFNAAQKVSVELAAYQAKFPAHAAYEQYKADNGLTKAVGRSAEEKAQLSAMKAALEAERKGQSGSMSGGDLNSLIRGASSAPAAKAALDAADSQAKFAAETHNANLALKAQAVAAEEAGAATAGSMGIIAGVATAVVAAVVAVSAGISAMALSARAAADAQDELAQKLGVSRERLVALQIVADENGASVEGLVKVYDKLTRSMNKMDEDNAKTIFSFESLGMSLEDIKNQKPEQVAAQILKNYDAIGVSAKTTAAVMQLLGPNFREQSIAIREAGDNMYKYTKRVTDFGGVASDNLVKMGGEQEKSLTNLGTAWKELKNQVAESTGEQVKSFVDWAAKAIKSIADVTRSTREYKAMALNIKENITPERRIQIGDQVRAEQAQGAIPNTTAAFIQRRLELYNLEIVKVKELIAEDTKLDNESQRFANRAKTAEQARIDLLKKRSAAAKQPDKAGAEKVDPFIAAKEDLLRQIDLTKEATTVEKTLFEVTDGKYKDLLPLQKQELVNLARGVDYNAQKIKQEDALAAAKKTLTGEEDAIKLQEYELTLTGKTADERERLVAAKKEELKVDKLKEGTSPAGQAEIDALAKAQAGRRENIRVALEESKQINTYLDSSEATVTANVQRNIKIAAKLLEEGKITQDDFLRYAEEQTNKLAELHKEKAGEVVSWWADAAKGIQGALDTFFFDLMQGKMDDLGSSFKKVIDQMVANALAARLANALFGPNFDKGQTGGLVGQAGSFLSSYFGGARAGGGDVQAGKSYWVGENGPELKTFNTGGTVIPNELLNTGGNTSVNVSISATDSRSFLQQIDMVKREIAMGVHDATRKYNLRAA
jgi:hypothetical protein